MPGCADNPDAADGWDYGYCDGGQYSTEDCGWDGGDCVEGYPDCQVTSPEIVGDGNCNGGQYNTEDCGWDGGDCVVPGWPDCHVDNPGGLGNGQCHKGSKADTVECGFDLGDCSPNIDVNNLKSILNNYPGCYFDGMDLSWIGDGICDGGLYDREVCGHDGGDCIVQGYPDCNVDDPDYIGDDACDGGQYNTEKCGWDGGDCVDFNRQYPNCEVETPYYLGDEDCDGGRYNTEECGWDGGDCLIAEWPDCHIDYPDGLGNGLCNAGSKADVVECGFDGGDCTNLSMDHIKDLLRRYPNCREDNGRVAGMNDGYCFDSLNMAKCGWDGGDCLFERNNNKCNGSVRSTWSNKSRAWCQNKCLDEGSSCKAYDIGTYSEGETGRCRIFSRYSSSSYKYDSKCYKKK